MPEALPGAAEVLRLHEEGLEALRCPVGQHHGRQEVHQVLGHGPGGLRGAPPALLPHFFLGLFHLVGVEWTQIQTRAVSILNAVDDISQST